MTIDIQYTPKRGLDGLLTITADGQPTVVLEDELYHQLMHLLRAVEEILTGTTAYAAVPYSSMPGAYELTPDGDEWVLSGDYVPTARYPRDAFVHAVLAAADRWLVHATEVGDPDHEGVAPLVAEAVAQARAALPA